MCFNVMQCPLLSPHTDISLELNVLLSTPVLFSLLTAYRGLEEKLAGVPEEEGRVTTVPVVREAGLRGSTWSVYSLGGGMMGA